MTLYSGAALVDTSAALALKDTDDRYHKYAKSFFESNSDLVWVALNVTAHESFTRARYSSNLLFALEVYDFLVSNSIKRLTFSPKDEEDARCVLVKYSDQRFSFHDVLCSVVMKRLGIYRVFTFDRDFWVLGHEILPGFI